MTIPLQSSRCAAMISIPRRVKQISYSLSAYDCSTDESVSRMPDWQTDLALATNHMMSPFRVVLLERAYC